MKKKLRIALFICITLLTCVLVLTSCDEASNTQTPSVTTDETSSGTTEFETTSHTHSFSEWKTTKEATCAEVGMQERTCECGEKETKSIDKKTEHTAGAAVTENYADSTCKVEGSYDEVVYCSVCDKELSRTQKTVAKKTEHTAGTSVTENYVDSTCKVEGSYDEVAYCSVCDKELSRTQKTVAKKTEHTAGTAVTENYVDSTCKVEGSYDEVVYCSVCEKELSRTQKTIAKKTEHTYGEWNEILAPTCTEKGSERRDCDICEHYETRDINANGHTNAAAVVENKVDATCTADGSYDSVIYCSVCTAEVSRESKVIGKLGHNHSTEWTVDVEPTCTEKEASRIIAHAVQIRLT